MKKEWFNKPLNIWRAFWKYGNQYFYYIEHRTRETKHDGFEFANCKMFSDSEKFVVNLF